MRSGTSLSLALGCVVLAATAYGDTGAYLRPGHWQVTTTVSDFPKRIGVYEMCIDHATERRLVTHTEETRPKDCSRYDRTFTSTGATIDTVCSLDRMVTTTHRVIAYASDTAYTENIHALSTWPNKPPMEAAMLFQGKWQGPCPASMKPGDMTQMSVTTAPN